MKCLRLSVRGASHAEAIRFRLEGFPSDFTIDRENLAAFMARRAPGRDVLSTQRKEDDEVELIGGQRSKVKGQAIEGVIRNTDTRPQDYGAERTVPRPGHADFGQWIEMGRIPTGGGKNSGRLTVALCAAGGICKQWLESRGIAVEAEIASIGQVTDTKKYEQEILAARNDLDSVGGTIRCRVTGVKPGLGGALFDGLEGSLSQAVFAIPGVKGIAFGNGFEAATLRGSENNDAFVVENGPVRTATNRHGGILGGRTTGMPIEFTVAMKPTPTIYKEQDSVDLKTMQQAKLAMKGRHDPCIVRRAVPVVEAMAAYVLADAIMTDEAAHPRICLTLTGKTIAEDFAQYESQRYFTDMVELRADLLTTDEREKIPNFLSRIDVPVIVTLRQKRDGGMYVDPLQGDGRKIFFRRLLLAYRPPRGQLLYIDLEDDYRSRLFEKFVANRGVRIVRSHHDFRGKPEDIVALLRKMRADTDAIPKIAFMPKNLEEVAAAYAEVKDFREFPFVLCVMGPMGLVSRACACRYGSAWTYASVGGLEDIGHVTPEELVRTYRIRQQTRDWQLYGVTGWPLKKTRSPEINNAAWSDEDEDRVMIPLPCRSIRRALAFFKAMGMSGMAVTIPHKQTALNRMRALGRVAVTIGAVNTVVRKGGVFVGYNTDAEGFSAAIRRFVGREDFTGLQVAVLGAGGAAQAVCYALKELGATVKVYHRKTPRKVYDLIVNATPVDPIPDYKFTGREMVYDLVYVPEVTSLMARAREAGCRVEDGFSMLTAQAAEQRRLWKEVNE